MSGGCRGRAIGAAARGAGGGQGHHRHGGHADRERVGAARRADAVARRERGGEAARGRRGDHGQDGDDGVRDAGARQDAQSAQPGAHAGRLVERLGGGGGGRHGAARARQPDRRVDDPAGVVLRRLRPQADARADPASGMFQLSRTLDHVGLFARGDRGPRPAPGAARRPRRARSRHAAARARALSRGGGRGAAAAADVRLREDGPAGTTSTRTPARPSPSWPRTSGDRVEEVELATPAAETAEWHRTIMDAELALNLEREWRTGRDRLSASLRARIEHGHEVRALDYLRALTRIPQLNASFTELFEQRYDAILTPAATGTAPAGLESTGDPAFCALWTLCGMPAISLPLMQGRQRPAAGRPARRAPPRRRPTAAHRALARDPGLSRRLARMLHERHRAPDGWRGVRDIRPPPRHDGSPVAVTPASRVARAGPPSPGGGWGATSRPSAARGSHARSERGSDGSPSESRGGGRMSRTPRHPSGSRDIAHE